MDRLYRRYSDEVLRYALMVLRSRADAEDIVQIVFVRALRAIERGEKVRTPRNWLIKIAHNECRRLMSSRKIHAELPDEIAVEPVETGRVAELRTAMAALPEAQRQALVLRELEGRTYVEIATALGLTVSAVETLIFRARRTLREQIEASMSCEDFALLLDDPDARSRIRAHARMCPDCATLERQARGRKSALKRIASMFGLPWWGAKLAAIGITAGAVASVAAVAAAPQHHHPKPVPQSRTTFTRSIPAKSSPAPLAHSPVVARTLKVSDTSHRQVSGTRATHVVVPLGKQAPSTTPAPPLPDPQPGDPPLPPAAAAPPAKTAPAVPVVPVAVNPSLPTPPAVTVPVTTPVVATPTVSTPAATIPALSVPSVTVQTQTVPAITTPTVPVEPPKVSVP